MEKKSNSRSSTSAYCYDVALGGIITCLCMVCMFLTGVIPALYLLLPMLCSGLIYIMVMETDNYWGWMTYVSVGLLSLIMTPNKDAALVFLLFFGYYPMLRRALQKIKIPLVPFILRWGVFNAAVFAFYYGSVYLLGAEELVESLGEFGEHGAQIMWVICNIMFVSYDYLMGEFPELYTEYLKPRINPSK